MIDLSTLETKAKEKKKSSKGRKNKSSKKGLGLLFKPEKLEEEKPVETTPVESVVREEIKAEPVQVESKPEPKVIETPVATKVEVQKPKKVEPVKEVSAARVIIKSVEPAKSKKTTKKSKIKVKGALKKPRGSFTQVHNEVIETIINSNLSANEIKFLLLIYRETVGWGKDYAILSASDIKKNSKVTANLLYKTRDTLKKNGIIDFGTCPDTNRNYYFIKESFFRFEKASSKTEEDQSYENIELMKYLTEKGVSTTYIANEVESFQNLLSQGFDENLILETAKYIDENKLPNGEICAFPIKYLATGAMQTILNWKEGKASKPNKDLILDLIYNVSREEPMPESYKSRFTEVDLKWIEDHGGRRHLSSISDFELKSLF
jgi:hypothetical protein